MSRAVRQPVKFLVLSAQLGALLLAFRVYQLETPAFLLLSAVAFAGFAAHYWLPFHVKEQFLIGLSLAAAFLLLEPRAATLLIALGLVFFGITVSPIGFRWKVTGIGAIGVVLIVARGWGLPGLPNQFWPVFGAIFMFRMMVYLYDLRHMRTPPSIKEYLTYFFLLPNYYFLLFPVVDFQTLRRSYYQRDIHAVAQQGIAWMVRGTVQLLIYRVIYQLKPAMSPDTVTTLSSLALAMVTTYMLYLRVSGQFHIIVGMLHLFGYDLPETHRRYFLASSLTDFWRRINIYWKDFMVKLVYFPVYFRLRKGGETRAQILATALVFTATWLLHSYQWWWLKGELLLTWPDMLFWGILGALVAVNLLWESRTKSQRRPVPSARVRHVVTVACTFAFITVLWSLWNSPTVGAWLELITWWELA